MPAGFGGEGSNGEANQASNRRPGPAESGGRAGWLYTLNSFLERAFTEADRATGC